jgi:hypothetical protein
MNKLFLIFLIFSNVLSAQNNEEYLTKFLLGDELKLENEIDKYVEYDFSTIWTKTKNVAIYGIIGDEHQRIRIKLISVKKNPINPNEYLVIGKSNVKETICDFSGIIKIAEIREVKEFHFGVDSEFESKGIKSQGILIAKYEFKENKEQIHAGVFAGELYSKWYLDSKNKIKYDDIQSVSDGYSNNAFIGIWKSYNTTKEKVCNWADYRVPNANQDFDIGAGEFGVSEKYWNKGWLDIALRNQMPNGAIIKNEKTNKNIKEWWE